MPFKAAARSRSDTYRLITLFVESITEHRRKIRRSCRRPGRYGPFDFVIMLVPVAPSEIYPGLSHIPLLTRHYRGDNLRTPATPIFFPSYHQWSTERNL
jgi:hypothetical protein